MANHDYKKLEKATAIVSGVLIAGVSFAVGGIVSVCHKIKTNDNPESEEKKK